MRAAAELLLEQAKALEELAQFFGGNVAQPITPVAHVVTAPKPRSLRGAGVNNSGARPLTPEDKEVIKKDWELFPEHLRTRENRAALARKHQCSIMQVSSLTRPKEFYKMLTESSRAARRSEIIDRATRGNSLNVS
jgi:hypothetical protein